MSEFMQDVAPTDDNFATRPVRPVSHLATVKKKPALSPKPDPKKKPSPDKKISPPPSAKSGKKPSNKDGDAKSEKSAGKLSGKVK
jgi:hypothetical protein